MSIFALEKLMYEICNSGERADQYRSDPAGLMARQPLTPREREMLGALDVRAMTDYGVNPMLIMTTWNTVKGPDFIGEYLGRLNAPAATGA